MLFSCDGREDLRGDVVGDRVHLGDAEFLSRERVHDLCLDDEGLRREGWLRCLLGVLFRVLVAGSDMRRLDVDLRWREVDLLLDGDLCGKEGDRLGLEPCLRRGDGD